GTYGESAGKSRTIPARKTGQDIDLQIRWKGRRALDLRRLLRTVQFEQSQKVREDGPAVPAAGGRHLVHYSACPGVIQPIVHPAEAEKPFGRAPGLFVGSHCYAASCLEVSSARRL